MKVKLIVVASGILMSTLSLQAPASAAGICGTWSLAQSDNPSTRINEIKAETSITGTDAWGVGYQVTNGENFAMTLHWNGTSWTQVPTNLFVPGTLTGVAAVSSSDVWAVGYTYDPNPPRTYGQLILHWNGQGWSNITPPITNASETALFGTSVIPGTRRVLAVGYVQHKETGPFDTLVEERTLSGWSVISTRHPTSANSLEAVTVTGRHHAWAVGEKSSSTGYKTLIESWNGTTWSLEPSPNVGTSNNQLLSVSALGNRNIWAVGQADYETLTEHWNGFSWKTVASPNPGSYQNSLLGVKMFGVNDVWAVGFWQTRGYPKNLTEHWDGTSWSQKSIPEPGAPEGLDAVGGTAGSDQGQDIWAVGYYTGLWQFTEAFHFC